MQLPLLAELKRRRVFRALVGYSILAFALLQVIEPVMRGLHWPEAVLSYAVVALALGFPLVVTLASIFDVRAGRIERTGPPTDSRLKGIGRAMVIAGIGVLIAAPSVAYYSYMMKAMYAEAEEEMEHIPSASAVRLLTERGRIAAMAGRRSEALRAVQELEALSRREHVRSM